MFCPFIKDECRDDCQLLSSSAKMNDNGSGTMSCSLFDLSQHMEKLEEALNDTVAIAQAIYEYQKRDN